MSKFKDKLAGALSSRGLTSGTVTALIIAVVAVLNVLIYTLTSVFGLYLYTPTTYDFSLSGAMDEMLAEAEADGKEVTLTFCMAESDLEVHPRGAFVLRTARRYAEKYPQVKLHFVNLLTSMDKDGNIVDLSKYKTDMRGNETPIAPHSVIFSSGEGVMENYRVITDTYSTDGFADFYAVDGQGYAYSYYGEEIIGSMIAWVLHTEHRVAYMTSNHGETVDSVFANQLASAGYYVDVINLRNQEIPEDAGLVVISNPTTDFERSKGDGSVRAELDRLAGYLESGNGGKGGCLYVAIDPYADRLPALEEFLSERGITVTGRQGEYGYSRDVVADTGEGVTLDNLSFVATPAGGAMASAMAERFAKHTEASVLMSNASRLEIDGSKGAEALLLSSPDSRVTSGGSVVDSAGSYAVAAYSEREGADGARSRVFVVSSVLLTNADVLIANGYSNKEFIYSLLEVAFDGEVGIYGAHRIVFDNTIVEGLTQKMAGVYTVFLLAIPAALAVIGTVVCIRRKNK
jgi:hypothetical protein